MFPCVILRGAATESKDLFNNHHNAFGFVYIGVQALKIFIFGLSFEIVVA